MHNYRELKIWQRSMDLVEMVYIELAKLKDDEKFGLKSQMKRSAVSIPSNIAEGAGRDSNKQYLYFLNIALGSCNELSTQIELAARLSLIEKNIAEKINIEINEIFKMIFGFYKKLEFSK